MSKKWWKIWGNIWGNIWGIIWEFLRKNMRNNQEDQEDQDKDFQVLSMTFKEHWSTRNTMYSLFLYSIDRKVFYLWAFSSMCCFFYHVHSPSSCGQLFVKRILWYIWDTRMLVYARICSLWCASCNIFETLECSLQLSNKHLQEKRAASRNISFKNSFSPFCYHL